MLNQNDVKVKFQDLKGNIQNYFHRFFNHDKEVTSQADGVVEPPLTDGKTNSEKLVWDDDQKFRQ